MAASWPGLDDAQARDRLAEFGPNALTPLRGRSLWHLIIGTLREPMFLLLIAASGLYLVLGEFTEGLFLTVAAVATVGLVVIQEARSERALKALRDLSEPSARVVRGGTERVIPITELVPGDIILVGEGQRLPADGTLVDGEVLSVDESALTGESAPVSKMSSKSGTTETGASDTDADARLFAGPLVVAGQGVAQVSKTGARTALGETGASLASIQSGPTPLQKSAGRLVGWFGGAAILICAAVVIAYGLLRGDWFEAALVGITVAISLIPEEFPMVLAVFMALGAWRLAQRKVLVRRGAVIETLGGASILCVDKTGTITENLMTVASLWTGGKAYDPRAADLATSATNLLDNVALECAVHPTDPMDRAIRLLSPKSPADAALVRTWPLEADRMAVVQQWALPDGARFAAAKGAPEAVFDLCAMTESDIEPVRQSLELMATKGLRVLVVASVRGAKAGFAEPEEAKFEFSGLVGFLDPFRAEVPAASAMLTAALYPGLAAIFRFAPPPPAILLTGIAVATVAGGWTAIFRGVLRMADHSGAKAQMPEETRRRVEWRLC